MVDWICKKELIKGDAKIITGRKIFFLPNELLYLLIAKGLDWFGWRKLGAFMAENGYLLIET